MRPRTKVADLVIGEFYEVRDAQCMLLAMRVERTSYKYYYAFKTKDGFEFAYASDPSKTFVVTYYKIGLRWVDHLERQAQRENSRRVEEIRDETDRRTILRLVNALGSLGVSLVDANRYSEDNLAFAPTRLTLRPEEAQGIVDMLHSKGVLR